LIGIWSQMHLGAVITCDWFSAGGALLCEQLAVAVDAVGLVIDWREPLSTEHAVTVSATETVAVPRTVVVNNSAFADWLQRDG